MNKRTLKLVTLVSSSLLLLSLTACESVKFYSQAAQGHSQIMLQRQPIQHVINAPETTITTRNKLATVQAARDFAINHLKLPNNGSYTQYVDIKRPYVVWNVVATKAHSTKPIQHCFPIAGCVSYRGYFSQQAAHAYANQLKAQGYDTIISGAAAYSTLGWFSDPVLNTMLRRSDLALAGLIFHELAHQQVYQAGDTAFNESFATAVEQAGIDAWAKHQQHSPDALQQYRQAKKINANVVALILKHRQQLEQSYQALLPTDLVGLENAKKEGIAALQQEYKAMSLAGKGSKGYDRWFAQPLNNASLVLFGDYHGWLGAFENLLAQSQGDWSRFYEKVEALAKLDKKARTRALQNLQAP